MYHAELQKIIDSFTGKMPGSEDFTNFLAEINASFLKESDGKDYNPRLNTEDAILVVENSTDMVALHEPDLTCTYISPSCRDILGYEPEEVLGIPAYDYFHPDDIPLISRLHEDALKNPEKRVTVTYRLRHKAGHYVWVETTAKIILDEVTGQPKKIIAAARDITSRKEFEKELLQGQIRLELLNAIMEMRIENKPAEHIINYTLESLQEYFPEFRISYTTLDESTGIQSLDYMIGFTDEVQSTMRGKKLDLNRVPEILKALKGRSPLIIRDALHDERFQNVKEYITRRGTRSIAYFPARYAVSLIGILSVGSPGIRDLTRFEISAFKEVSQQLGTTLREFRLNQERNRAVLELSKREQEIKTILENTPDLIVRCDRNLRYSYVNTAVERVTGMPIEKFIGKTNEELGLPQVVAHLWNKRAKRVFATGKAESLEFETATENGNRTFQVNIIPECNAENIVENLLFVGRDITILKNAQSSLRQSEERFRTFMDNIPHIAFIKDENGKYVYINRALKELANRFSMDILLKTDYDWLPGEVADNFKNIDRQVLETGQPTENLELFKKDDTLIYFLTNKFLLKNTKGERLVGGLSIDITGQKEAELQIRHSEEMFRSIFENSATGMWLTDMEWETIESNPAAEAMLGYTGNELLNITLPDLIIGEDREEFLKIYREIDSRQARFVQHDRRLMTKTGQIIWANIITSVVQDSGGKPRFAITMISDITERVNAEETIRENEARFRAIFETAGIGIVLVSPTGYILKTNPSFEKITGYTGEELSLMHFREFTHPDDLGMSLDLFRTLSENKTNYYVYEKRYIRKNGETIWARAAASMVKNASGKPMYIIGTIEEITEQRTYTENLKNLTEELRFKNQELKSAKENAERANKAKSIFLSSMSHELRTPLNAILGFAQILQKDESIAPRQRNFIETIYKSGNHLLDMINDVLDISKIESGKMELFPDDFDLIEMLRDTHDMFNLPARQKGIQFTVSCSAGVPRVIYGDAKRLRQILINLLSNAVKFTYNGRITLHITAQKRGNDSVLCRFVITDTGRGIPQDQLEVIFEPFRQMAGTYSEGSGLGLAISRRIAHLMDGTISVSSVVGEGSEFIFTVPLKPIDSALTYIHALPKTDSHPPDSVKGIPGKTTSGEKARFFAISNAILNLPEEFSDALADAVEVQDSNAIEIILDKVLNSYQSPDISLLKQLDIAARTADYRTLTHIGEILYNTRTSRM